MIAIAHRGNKEINRINAAIVRIWFSFRVTEFLWSTEGIYLVFACNDRILFLLRFAYFELIRKLPIISSVSEISTVE